MSEPESASPVAVSTPDEKRQKALQVIAEILKHMDVPAKLDAKIASDGGISVALELEGDPPGATPGRRTHVTDALQFIANKIVNRPGSDRRWISLGIGGHPEPRQRLERKRPAVAPAPTPTPARAPGPPVKPGNGNAAPPASAPRESEEADLQVSEDTQLVEAARVLAQKSSSFGRFYAIVSMSREDRARVIQASRGVAGVKVSAEGEGRQRRVVFTPEKPAPMPKKTLPAFDDE